MKAQLDYQPAATSAGHDLLGEWLLTVSTDDGAVVEMILADQRTCIARARALGLKSLWTERARKAAWQAFRKAYR